MHLMIVADTQDMYIGSAVQEDVKRIKEDFSSIAKSAEMGLNVQKLSLHETTAQKVIARIGQLKVQKDDAIVFYYSGHGWRPDDKPSQWPMLAWEGRLSTDLDFEDVINKVKSKKARFSLVLADCCNSLLPYESFKDYRQHKRLSLGSKNFREASINLFAKSRGFIAATSSMPGQFSYCDPFIGGYFTHCLLESLKYEMQTHPNPKWSKISILAQGYLFNLVQGEQTPVFSVRN